MLVDFSVAGVRMTRRLNELAGRHGLPEEIVMDNGPEMTGRALFECSRDAWNAQESQGRTLRLSNALVP